MAHPARVRMAGPLTPYQDTVWTALLEHGYTLLSAEGILQVAAHLSRWLDKEHLSASDLNRSRIEAYLAYRRACGSRRCLTPSGLAAILEPLRALGVVPPAESPPRDRSAGGRLLWGFESYLIEERGIQPSTAAKYRNLMRRFVDDLRLLDLSELGQLSAKTFSGFILRELRCTSTGYLKHKITALRSFARYLHVHGFCGDLSAAVPTVAGYRLAGLPKAIPQGEVRRIEGSCSHESRAGRRDHAILLLLSRLGLRAGEIAALGLDDLRWSRGEIVVRGKGVERILPLPQVVGDALADYLKHRRPASSCRRVFLHARAPYREITATAVNAVVKYACQRAGLSPMGPHRLRHTAATWMLHGGAHLTDIAQVLGHRRLDTTAIYAKVDHRALRPLARRWPGGTS